LFSFSFRDILLLTSDVDEIPRSRFLYLLKSCGIPRQFPPTVLQCDAYYYSFEFRSSSNPVRLGTTLSRFNARQMIPSGIYNARSHYRPIPHVCFHCSYCFDTVTLVRSKLTSFSHTELDIARYHNLQYIIDRFQNGKYLFRRFRRPFQHMQIHQNDVQR
jgi:beta-1,4-mannosyl-glycoprotein beta-1,4-N-acetylglucosaminyltransferase